jgi:hypothetical protein
MSSTIARLERILDARLAQADAVRVELSALRQAMATAPAFVNMPFPPVTDAQIDALSDQEAGG